MIRNHTLLDVLHQVNSSPIDIITDKNYFQTSLGIIWTNKHSCKRHPELNIHKETKLAIWVSPGEPF